jgi:hypothetical protein
MDPTDSERAMCKIGALEELGIAPPIALGPVIHSFFIY